MATHTSSQPSGDAAAEHLLNFIDIATKLASNTDGPLCVKLARGHTEVIPHFTEWSQLSDRQKVRIFDLLVDYHAKGLGSPETDVSQRTDASFIGNTDLQKKSAELSEMLCEGMNTLRERTEDVLTFSFTVKVDKLSGFGRNSRELARCIEYRVPHIYRNNSQMHDYCQLYANAVASVVIDWANMTPFRRGYSSDFANKYKSFTLMPDAQLPYLVDPVELSGPPIIPDPAALAASVRPGTTTLTPTAIGSPVMPQRNSTLRPEPSFWSNISDLDYESKEVQRALDMAEMAAFGQVPSVAYQRQQVAVAEDNASTAETTGEEEASTLDDLTSISESTLTGSTATEPFNRQVFGQPVPVLDVRSHQLNSIHTGSHGARAVPLSPEELAQYAGGNHHLHFSNPMATVASSLPADMHPYPAQGTVVVPTGFIVLQAPVTPSNRHRTSTVSTPPTTRFTQQNATPSRGVANPTSPLFGPRHEVMPLNSPSHHAGKGREARSHHKHGESSSRGTRK